MERSEAGRRGRLRRAVFVLWAVYVGATILLFFTATPLQGALERAGLVPAGGAAALLAVPLGLIGAAIAGAVWISGRIRSERAWRRTHAAGALLGGGITWLIWTGGGGLFLSVFRTPVVEFSDRFTFGPYPLREDVDRLRREGYAGVVTLLSPVLPFEGDLLERERRDATSAGIPLVEIPLVPWVGLDEGAQGRIRELVRSGKRYYVHCYLGRHRTMLMQSFIRKAAGAPPAASFGSLPDRFERGPLHRVSDRLVVGPLPTQEEWFGFVAPCGTRRVICLLDPASGEDAPWIDSARRFARSSGIEYLVQIVLAPEDVPAAVRRIRESGDPTYVHGFGMEERIGWVRDAAGKPE